MPRIALTIAVSVLACASASASDVFVTKDAQGRLVYTDRPDTLPAAKVNVATQQSDVVEAQARREQQMKANAAKDKAGADAAKQTQDQKQAAQLTATDKAKRCQDARTRYEAVMTSHRLYEQGATPEERRYLNSEEIDTARADAKKVMDEFCAGQ